MIMLDPLKMINISKKVIRKIQLRFGASAFKWIIKNIP